MKRLLCAALIFGGCAGRPPPELTPSNVKTGAPRLLVGFPSETRTNVPLVIEVMLKGRDRRFSNIEYALVIAIGPSRFTMIVYPTRLRYWKLKFRGPREFQAWAGTLRMSVSLHPVVGYMWNGEPLLGPLILHEDGAAEMKGWEAD